MNAKELLNKCINKDLKLEEELPTFRGLYIIPQRRLHDSGYKCMYVIGHTVDDKYYLVGIASDVVDIMPYKWQSYSRNIQDLHLDINKYGIIHIWTMGRNKLKCYFPFVSSCIFEVVK